MILTKNDILFLSDFFNNDIEKYLFCIREEEDDDESGIVIRSIYFYKNYYVISIHYSSSGEPFYLLEKNIYEDLDDLEEEKLKKLKLASKISNF